MGSKEKNWSEEFKLIGKKKPSPEGRFSKVLSSPPEIDFDELEIFCDHVFFVDLPYHYSKDLKKYVFAALKAYGAGFRSIDYVIKRYGKTWDFPEIDEDRKELYIYLDKIKSEVEQIVNHIASEYIPEQNLGKNIAQAALIRLKASYSSATLLISRN